MKNDRFLSMLGLAARAGKVASGEFSAEKAVKEGKAYLMIIAEDASDNTKKRFVNMCTYYEVPYLIAYDKDTLGYSIGRQMRTSAAVTDGNFANGLSGIRTDIIRNTKDTEKD